MSAANLPTVLVIATSPESNFGPYGDPLLQRSGEKTLLERHIESLAALDCTRFVIVASEAAEPVLNQLRDALAIHVRFVPAPADLAAAYVAAEPPLAHFASGPVLVTQPHYVVEPSLYRDLLDAWVARPSGVEGIIATAKMREPRTNNLCLLLEGERLTRCILDDASNIGEAREYVGAMTYSWSRELCETIGEEADKHGPQDAVALGLNRLMAWNDVRNLPYSGAWHRLGESEELQDSSDAATSTVAPSGRRPSRTGETRLQRPYSPR
jgi:NDP-sugar pyrophosphorylase family protein